MRVSIYPAPSTRGTTHWPARRGSCSAALETVYLKDKGLSFGRTIKEPDHPYGPGYKLSSGGCSSKPCATMGRRRHDAVPVPIRIGFACGEGGLPRGHSTKGLA